jgi:Rrf2 family protein
MPARHNGIVRISAKTDYAIRAAVELASGQAPDGPVTAEAIAEAQDIPLRFLLNILADLRRSGLVTSKRGTEGGWWLARPAADITVADVIRAIDGPLANVAGIRPEELGYRGSAASLKDLWIALRYSIRDVLETVTLADLATGALPKPISRRTHDPDAWLPH